MALLPWGDVFVDFLDRLGVTFEQFRDEFVGSWMFGYASALATAGCRTVMVCPTTRVREPLSAVHAPTGAELRLVPAPRLHDALRTHALDGRLAGRRDPRSIARAGATHLSPYVATPPVALARLVRREGCAAILCQEYEDPRFDVCVAVGRAIRVPVFGVFQGANYRNSRLERPLRPLSIRASAGLVVGAEREARRVRDAYGIAEERLAHIVNPIDMGFWRREGGASAREELRIGPDALVVVWHGQMQMWRKGLDVLLESWARATAALRERDVQLVLVGTGEDAAKVRDRVASLALPNVSLVDEWVRARVRMRSLLSAGDLYVFPSRHEGLAVAPLEAMACGLAVVGADASGVRDVVGDAGVVVPCGDVDALADALVAILGDDGHRRTLAERARTRVEERFSLAAVGADLRAFVIDRRRA